jgi:putative sigma-54 modulation protein
MNINITFRHVEASDAIKNYASEKISKLQKFLSKPMEVKVTLSLEKLKHMVEVRLSSGTEHIEAHDASDDMYASIDRVIHKLERQIRESKGAIQAKRRGGDTVRGAESNGELLDSE